MPLIWRKSHCAFNANLIPAIKENIAALRNTGQAISCRSQADLKGNIMAFSQVGHFWLWPGDTMWISLRFVAAGVGKDQGAQWIMANPLPFDRSPTPSGTSALESRRFQKEVAYFNGGAEWTYYCEVENRGSLGTYFDLTGGGNV